VKRVLLSIGFVCLGLLLGCGGGGSNGGNPQPPVLQSIQVTPANPSITIAAGGATQPFTATGRFNDGSTKDLSSSASWSSSDTAVATISATGVATGLKKGSATITATSGGVSGKTTLTIGVALKSIAITPATPSIARNTQQQFTATGTYFDGTIQNITTLATWSSATTAVATIIVQGVAQAGNQAGTTTITAALNGVSGSTTLTVTNATPTLITVTPANPTISVFTQQKFTARGTFSDGTSQDITNVSLWSSSANGVASVTSNSGVATGNNKGTATITASFGGVNGNTSITVDLANVVSISISPKDSTIAHLTNVQFGATGTLTDGSTHNVSNLVTWSSSNTSVATIGAGSGLASNTAPGDTTITATLSSLAPVTTNLHVSSATLSSIAIAPSGASVNPGTKLNFTAVGTFDDASTQTITSQVTWDSSNKSAATITGNGSATAVAAGTTNISATATFAPTISRAVQLTVTGLSLRSIAVTPASTFTAPGGSVQFIATGTFSDNSTQNLTQSVAWNASPSSVATVSTGLARGQGVGTATITATLTGVSGTASLKVTNSQLTSITVTSPNPASNLAVETSAQLTATGNFADGSTQNLTGSASWTSSKPAIATVSGVSGVVNGVAPGAATITASFGGISGTISLNITNAVLTSVQITPANPSISLGSSEQFVATGMFNDGTTEILTNFASWNSSNAGVAVLGSPGLFTTSGTGTTTIKATVTQSGTPVSGSTTLTVN